MVILSEVTLIRVDLNYYFGVAAKKSSQKSYQNPPKWLPNRSTSVLFFGVGSMLGGLWEGLEANLAQDKMVSRLQKSKFWSSLGGNHGDQNRWKTILKKYFKCFYELFFETIWNQQEGILNQHESNLRSTWINMRTDWGQLEATWKQLEAIQSI